MALAGRLAPHLPGFIAGGRDDWPCHALLTHEDGRTIALGKVWGTRDRIEVRGEHPDKRKGPTITVSALRDPKAIARDIERRLLPAYAESLAASRAIANRDAGELAMRQSFAAELREILPGPLWFEERGRSIEVHWYSTPGSGGVSLRGKTYGAADDIDLNVRMPVTTFVQLAYLLAGKTPPEWTGLEISTVSP
jgi:hypothetical protein